MMWDRKIEGGFPELKVLVMRFSEREWECELG